MCQLYLPEYKPRNQYLKANQFVVRIVDFIFLLLSEHSNVRTFVYSFVRLLFFPQFPSFTPFSLFRLLRSIFPSAQLTLFTLSVAIKYLVLRSFVFVAYTPNKTSFCVSRLLWMRFNGQIPDYICLFIHTCIQTHTHTSCYMRPYISIYRCLSVYALFILLLRMLIYKHKHTPT